ncbi:chromosome partitioning protein ParB [Nitrospira sp.]|nr:chromosome partitioning protein ParB [Nitrospira sp.]
MEKKALGRGLDALLPGSGSPSPLPNVVRERSADVLELELDHIVPNRYQPRHDFPESALEELSDSIKLNGLLQPIVVRRKGDGLYELIAGERRWRAAQRAGLHRISAHIRNCTDDEAIVLALVENIQRNDLNPIDTAHAYQRMMAEFGMGHDLIAHRVGRERSSIANQLRLLNLPDSVQQLVAANVLSMGHAKVILGLHGEDVQIRVAKESVVRQWSVRELERHLQAEKPSRKAKRAKVHHSPYQEVESRLQKRWGTKVTVERNGAGGRISLHFFSPEEQERLLEMLLS